jgi:2,3-dihydroxybenzoate decarboxylase
MIPTIAIEEACLHPGYTELSTRYTNGHSPIVDALCDIHGKRLQLMNDHGNEFQVLSLTSPGPQGETNVEKVPSSSGKLGGIFVKQGFYVQAEELARICNDWIAEEVKKNPKRFGAFCSLSMHRPSQAAKELRRAVTELGLVGAILNDWQATGSDGNGILLYDTLDFDPFWEVVQELGVPVYFHPKVCEIGLSRD